MFFPLALLFNFFAPVDGARGSEAPKAGKCSPEEAARPRDAPVACTHVLARRKNYVKMIKWYALSLKNPCMCFSSERRQVAHPGARHITIGSRRYAH